MYIKSLACSTLAVLVGLSLASRPASAQNVLANPGFEEPEASAGDIPDAAAGWTPFGDPYTRWITRQAPPRSGLQCLKMFGPWNQWGGTGMSQTFAAAAGQTWVAEIWSLNSSVDPISPGNFCVMKILFLDAGGVNPPGGEWLAGVNVFEITVADSTSPLEYWQLSGVGSAPAPEGTAFAQLLIVEVQGNNPPLGGSVFLDDAVLRLEAADVCALHDPVFDVNDDDTVDGLDMDVFQSCATGPAIALALDAPQICKCMDRNADNAVDMQDYAAFQRCYSKASGSVDPDCDNP